MIFITHLSRTPVANAIWSLASACSDHEIAPSRWISNGGKVGNLTFPHDVTWHEAEALSIMACSQIFILHNYLDIDDQPIMDFLMGNPQIKVGLFYHSHPDYVNLDGLRRGVPAFVVNQFQADVFQARGFQFMPTRNVIRFDREDFPVWKDWRRPDVRVGYSPTTRKPQAGKPYDLDWYTTKGVARTMPVLEAWADRRKLRELLFLEGVPYQQAVQWKSECDILVDEVVTGSFHRSALEGLAMGIPTICKLAPELDQRITELAGGDAIPLVRCNGPDELEEVLERLSSLKPKQRRELGVAGREWMHKHWHPRDIAREFADRCEQLPSFESLEVGRR